MIQNRYNRLVLPIIFLFDLILLVSIYVFLLKPVILFPIILVSIAWVITSILTKSYTIRRTYSIINNLSPMFLSLFLFTSIYALFIILGFIAIKIPIQQFYFLFSLYLLFPLLNILRYLFFYRYRLSGKNIRYIVLLTDESKAKDLDNLKDDAGHLGYHIVKVLTNPKTYLKDINTIANKQNLDFIFLKQGSISITDQISSICDELGLRLKILLPMSVSTGKRAGLDHFGGFPIMDLRYEPLLYIGNRIIKRTVDILMSVASIIFVLTWLPLVVKIVQIFFYPGPLFFIQERIGRKGKIFNLYKFRTMIHSSEIEFAKKGTSKKTILDDPRISWFGRLLRSTNLDEYPQFINVLFGSMSVVGPRPHMVGEDEKLEKIVRRYRVRRFVKPGITGWAAINGYRGGTESIKLMSKRTELDIWYLENWSIWLDLKIIFITVWQMITFKIPKAY